MKKTLTLIGLGMALVACTSKKRTDVDYVIRPIVIDSVPALHVAMQFDADSSGTTVLQYPNDAWGESDLFNVLHRVGMTEGEAVIEKNKDSGWIVLKHDRNLERLQFEYVIQQDFVAEITTEKVYRPIVQPEYFHVFSHNLFMVPSHANDTLELALQWEGFEDDFIIHNSFGSQERRQEVKISKKRFGSAIFVGGDFRVHRDTIQGNAISLATRGQWVPFKETEVMEVLATTLRCQRNFWDDHSQTYFTVTMQPFHQEMGSSFQGTGLTNSFATSVSNNSYTDLQQMVYLFNHELMHNWIGHTIENESEEAQYWFSEGFTDYYTHKNIALHRINGLDASYYIEQMNATVRNLFSSSVRNAPNSEINYANFWSNRDYGKLAYYRGTLFAFYMDQTIRKRSLGAKSLDDMMRDILADAVNSGQKLSHTYFLDVASRYMPEGFERFFETHILKGKDYPLVEIYSELGLQFEPKSTLYELGVQLSPEEDRVLSVVAGSRAEKAGVRAGDRLFSRSIWYGDASKEVELGILRNGQKIEVAYYPIREAAIPTLLDSETNRELLMPRP